ncbi:MAG: hypothetical protein MH219_05470 [Marinobacter sp.]|nr:hypothetical protein [Marinobacter sp.]
MTQKLSLFSDEKPYWGADQSQLDEQTIIASIISYEKRIIEEAAKPEAFKYKNNDAVNTYKTVMEVALEDDIISDDEKKASLKTEDASWTLAERSSPDSSQPE